MTTLALVGVGVGRDGPCLKRLSLSRLFFIIIYDTTVQNINNYTTDKNTPHPCLLVQVKKPNSFRPYFPYTGIIGESFDVSSFSSFITTASGYSYRAFNMFNTVK